MTFNYYFLSVLTIIFLLVWIITISRSVINFFRSIFKFRVKSPKLELMFKFNVVIFSFTTFLFLNYFMPDLYLLTGVFSIFQFIEQVLSLHLSYFPAISTYVQYVVFESTLLLICVEILALNSLFFFILHIVYYIHKKYGLSDLLAWNYTLEVGKAFLYFLTPFTLVYLIIWYNLSSDISIKLSLVLVIFGFVLWLLYKITSSYYYGISNNWINNESSTLSLFILILVFFVFPVIFWYIHDFLFLYFGLTVQNTIIVDFQAVLLKNNLITSSNLAHPWNINPLVLLIVTLFEIHRILLFDVFIAAVVCFLFVSYMQFTYLVSYIKSLRNDDFKKELQEKNERVYSFNRKIQNNFLLKFLFWIFIIFLSWDVFLVVYEALIVPLVGASLITPFKYIIVTYLIDNLSTLQYPFNNFSILLLLTLFIAVLVVLNIVSIKFNEESFERSFTGVFAFMSFSFVLVISYLTYDLQNYTFEPLQNFQIIYISNVDYSFYTLLMVGIYCDTLLMSIFITFVILKIKGRYMKTKSIPTDEELNKKTEMPTETNKVIGEEEEQEKEENIIRNDVDI